MKAGYAEVVENERVYGNVYAMWLRAPELAHGAYPGQFVMLRCSDDAAYADGGGRGGEGHADDPLLPRPMTSHYRRGNPVCGKSRSFRTLPARPPRWPCRSAWTPRQTKR